MSVIQGGGVNGHMFPDDVDVLNAAGVPVSILGKDPNLSGQVVVFGP